MSVQHEADLLRHTSIHIREIKEFEWELGIKPTEALARTSQERAPSSMFWLWMQRAGTLALAAPIDIRLAIGFARTKEDLPVDQVYKVDGYSVYYRQGNEFADPGSVTTATFARESAVRRVTVVIHEDLHGADNFDLPWEIEESLVTPLGALAAVEFFRRRSDSGNLQIAQARVEEERQLSRELNQIVIAAQPILEREPLDVAKKKVLALIASFPTYQRHFNRQTQGQHAETVVEAKLSHDLAYYRHFDGIVGLYEKTGDLKGMIRDLRKAPREIHLLARYLEALERRESVAAR